MRIYNIDAGVEIGKVLLYLTPDEAQELRDSLGLIITRNDKHRHEHIPDRESGFRREITVCVYRKGDLSAFDERSKRLILNDRPKEAAHVHGSS